MTGVADQRRTLADDATHHEEAIKKRSFPACNFFGAPEEMINENICLTNCVKYLIIQRVMNYIAK